MGHIPLQVGVTALYGKNGVGKTRLLRALRSALAGLAVDGALGLLHVRVPSVHDFFADPWRDGFENGMRTHLVDARGRGLAQITNWRDSSFSNEDYGALDEAVESIAVFAADMENEEFTPTSVGEMVAAHFRQLAFGPQVLLDAETLSAITQEVSESGFFVSVVT